MTCRILKVDKNSALFDAVDCCRRQTARKARKGHQKARNNRMQAIRALAVQKARNEAVAKEQEGYKHDEGENFFHCGLSAVSASAIAGILRLG